MRYLSPASSAGVLAMEDFVGDSGEKNVRDILLDKHPLPADPPDDALLPGEPEPVNQNHVSAYNTGIDSQAGSRDARLIWSFRNGLRQLVPNANLL